MTDRNNIEGFARRWSRRKLRRDSAPGEGQASSGAGPGTAPQDSAFDFTDFDFSALDLSSDYTRFMQTDVPAEVRNRALKMLWSSSEVIGRPDDLDDYLEDFSEEAMAIPAELAKSAYQIGCGFVTAKKEPVTPQDQPADSAVQSNLPETALASSGEQTAESPGDERDAAEDQPDAEAAALPSVGRLPSQSM